MKEIRSRKGVKRFFNVVKTIRVKQLRKDQRGVPMREIMLMLVVIVFVLTSAAGLLVLSKSESSQHVISAYSSNHEVTVHNPTVEDVGKDVVLRSGEEATVPVNKEREESQIGRPHWSKDYSSLLERYRRLAKAQREAAMFLKENYSVAVERLETDPTFKEFVGNHTWRIRESNGVPVVSVLSNPSTGEITGLTITIYVYNNSGKRIKAAVVYLTPDFKPLSIMEIPPYDLSSHPQIPAHQQPNK